jgi:hypothetical protein
MVENGAQSSNIAVAQQQMHPGCMGTLCPVVRWRWIVRDDETMNLLSTLFRVKGGA